MDVHIDVDKCKPSRFFREWQLPRSSWCHPFRQRAICKFCFFAAVHGNVSLGKGLGFGVCSAASSQPLGAVFLE